MELTGLSNVKEGVMIDDIEKVKELYDFLTGGTPEGMFFNKTSKPKMSHKKAFAVIYYLQEHLNIIPDYFELCWNCRDIFNTETDGIYWKSKGRYYCGGCTHLVPGNYDNNQRD